MTLHYDEGAADDGFSLVVIFKNIVLNMQLYPSSRALGLGPGI
jgi:hypothetical protein